MSERRPWIYLLYDLALRLASLLLTPWLLWRILSDPAFRRSLPGRLGFVATRGGECQRILLHGVSVGEIKALRPLVRHLASELPEVEIVVSSTTPSGLDTAAAAFPELTTVHFPLDFSGASRRFLERVKPTSVILAELEIWPNFLRACSRASIPVAIVNGRITERSMGGYRRVLRLLPQFDRIRLYCVQNRRYAERFRVLNVPPETVTVTGNLKYDSLPVGGGSPSAPWSTWMEGRPALVLASTHEPEELLLLPNLCQQLPAAAHVLVVPRHPRRAARLAQGLAPRITPRPLLLRSQCSEERPLPPGAVMIVDTFGELEAIYAVARAAFVGGSMIEHGGQNVLEPAAFGLPVVVGPHVENFSEEVELLAAAGGLVRAADVPTLLESLCTWLQDPSCAQDAGAASRAALDSQRGATLRTFAALDQAGMFQPQGKTPPV